MSTVSILRPEPDRPDSWTRFKENIAHLIIQSLLLLRMRDDLVKNEIELNRLLFLCILKANRVFDLPLPALDAKNSPHTTDEPEEERENNRPDLSWNLMNHLGDDNNLCRNFALECKRLGEKTSKSWILNKQYVTAGILRFSLEEKGYGKGCETGAMVGYVQDMEFDEILSEINSHLVTNAPSIPKLTIPAEGWQNQGVSHLSHAFQRVYIPFDFFLQHFWIDTRDCQYLPSKTISTSNESNDSSSEEVIKEDHKRGQKEHTEQKQSQLELPLENSFEPTAIYIEADLKKQKTDL